MRRHLQHVQTSLEPRLVVSIHRRIVTAAATSWRGLRRVRATCARRRGGGVPRAAQQRPIKTASMAHHGSLMHAPSTAASLRQKTNRVMIERVPLFALKRFTDTNLSFDAELYEAARRGRCGSGGALCPPSCSGQEDGQACQCEGGHPAVGCGPGRWSSRASAHSSSLRL